MPTAQLALDFQPHRNHRLFSDHYLDAVLPSRREWKAGLDDAASLRQRLRTIYRSYAPSSIEAQTERDWIRPVLEALDHTFEVQPGLQTSAGVKRPDYLLYQDEAALRANKGILVADTHLGHALAVADAKHWDRPLDQALHTGSDPFSNKNPGYQISFYVQQTGLAWGILTNGRLWRLYHRDTAHKLDHFYEVDLPSLLEAPEPEPFQYFTRFFGRAAFDDGALSLDQHLTASASYAFGVGEGLKGQVYQALRHVAQGFLDFPANGLRPDGAALKQIYDNALIFLYRLLFVLYAEARGLLPLDESAEYRESYSLHAIKHAVAGDLRRGKRLLAGTATLWPRLKELFRFIDEGFAPLRVASFNGGLFDPARHPFLEGHTVGDARLQQAIDMLARVGGEFVDYRDLSERHLGSIYEGLLEFRLCPMSEGESGTGGDGWTIDLLTDKGDRKASGSYYTPGFVTGFMVEQAIGPAVDAAMEGAAELGPDARAAAVLDLNVLDCSMGSGHFLVEATEYIARRLVAEDLLPAELREATARSHLGTEDRSLTLAARSGAAPSPAGNAFDELAYWKRRVAQSCIYGVDINPLAVDLAKLSLWLATAARDRPLSFLDHHLRPGNSLVGARLADLTPAPGRQARTARARSARIVQQAEASGQLSMLDDSAFRQSMSKAVGSMWLIEENPANTIQDVKNQEALYETLRQEFTRQYGRLADLATATRFGLEIDQRLWGPLADTATGKAVARLPQFEAWLADADALAERHDFFHWEVEFPEVFFDRFGRPLGDKAGFDVVIGNPPYVRQEALASLKPYLENKYSSYHGAADLYVYFYEQGLRLLHQSGRMAYVSSGTFARTSSGAPLRKLMPALSQVETVIDFGENQPFAGAEMVRPTITVLRKGPQERPFCSLFIDGKVPPSLEHALVEHGIECDAAALQKPEWAFQPAADTRLFSKIMAGGRPLADAVGGRLYRGVLTGLNEAFILDGATRDALLRADPACAGVLRRALRGEDLRPWYQEDEGRWLVVLPSGWTRANIGPNLTERAAWAGLRDRLPAIAAHLDPFAEAAMTRCDRGEFWWELRACNYYDAFDQPKIFWPDIAKLPRDPWGNRSRGQESGAGRAKPGAMSAPDPNCSGCQSLLAQIAALTAQMTQVQAQVTQLQARLNQNSRNSARPPSSDGPQHRPPPRPTPPGGRRPGGQPGHPGHQRPLKPESEVDCVVPLVPGVCAHCLFPLPAAGAPADPPPQRHQVIDLPPKLLETTEYQLHARTCPACGQRTWAALPPEVPAGVVGPGLQALCAQLVGQFHLSRRDLQELLADVGGEPLSLGLLSGLEERTAAALAAPYAAVAAAVAAAPAVNADETSWREGARKAWLWTATTPALTLFRIDPSRSRAAFEQLLPPVAPGERTVTSDRYRAYMHLRGDDHQLCWSHLIRDFTALAELKDDDERLGEGALAVAEALFDHWHAFRGGAIDRATLQQRLRPVQARLGRLLRRARDSGHWKGVGLARDLLRHWPSLWTFARVDGVEPTNNAAERAVRPGVLWRKGSFGNQGAGGRAFVERLLTVTGSLRQQGRSVFAYLRAAVRAGRVGGTAPSLLPEENCLSPALPLAA